MVPRVKRLKLQKDKKKDLSRSRPNSKVFKIESLNLHLKRLRNDFTSFKIDEPFFESLLQLM